MTIKLFSVWMVLRMSIFGRGCRPRGPCNGKKLVSARRSFSCVPSRPLFNEHVWPHATGITEES